MPIWPWKPLSRPNSLPSACSSSPLSTSEKPSGAMDHVGQRRELRQRFRQHDRAAARTAAAVGRGEGLVQVDVHGVDAEVGGADPADDGVEVGAVAVEEGAGRVDGVGDLDDVALEQPAGVGVGQHDRGDVVAQLRLQRVQIDAAGGVGRDGVHGEAAGRGRRRVGAVGGFRHQDAAAVAGARRRGPRWRRGWPPCRTARRGRRPPATCATAGMPVSVFSQWASVSISSRAPWTVRSGCIGWMSLRPGSRASFSFRRGLCFIVQEPSGYSAAVDRVVLLRQAGVVPDHLRLAQARQADGAALPHLAEAGFDRPAAPADRRRWCRGCPVRRSAALPASARGCR